MQTYDPRCYDLAATFLSDVGMNEGLKAEQYRCDLAAHIQSKIEEWIVDVVNVNELQAPASPPVLSDRAVLRQLLAHLDVTARNCPGSLHDRSAKAIRTLLKAEPASPALSSHERPGDPA